MGDEYYGEEQGEGAEVMDMEMVEVDDFMSTAVIPENFSEGETLVHEFMSLDVNKRFTTALHYLKSGRRRWDASSGDPKVQVLEEYVKMQMTKRDALEKTTPTILHVLAKTLKLEEIDEFPRDTFHLVLGYLLENTPADTPGPGEKKSDTVLGVAILHKNLDFINLVKECRPKIFQQLIAEQDSQGRNCLHYLFLLRPAVKLAEVRNGIEKRAAACIPEATPQALAAQDESGNTPIHYAVNYQLCWGRKNDEYLNRLQEMVWKADSIMRDKGAEYNKKNESPILYLQHTKADYIKRKKEIKSKTPEPPSLQASRPAPWLDDLTPQGRSARGGPKPHFMRSDLYPGAGVDGGSLTLVRRPSMGINAFTNAAPVASSAVSEEAKEAKGMKSVNAVLKFLTLHYIRERPDLEARELIYGKDKSDKNLYFDASSLRDAGAGKVVELIKRMSVGGFGETLSYVYLPSLAHDREIESGQPKKRYHMNTGLARKTTSDENPKIGRTCLVQVFNKLYEAGVRNILRLLVEDMKSPSHTDAAIELCLRGRDSLSESMETPRDISVETWDWQKPDMSIDVIEFGAPNVENLYLYWSGSQVVLRGWACKDGIPRLYASGKQKLKRVIIEASPGLETRERMDRVLSRFQNEVENNIGEGKVKFTFNHHMSGLLNRPDDIGRELSKGAMEGQQQQAWIQRMEDFRGALKSIHEELKRIPGHKMPRKVKVALIDDGVDLSRLDTYNETVEATGVSYCPPVAKTERPWSQSSNGHGTIMANMIVRVNPWARLHVMRLQDGQSNGTRTIFADSAAKAIMGAVHRKVDVISISWTIKQKIQAASSGGNFDGGNNSANDTSKQQSYDDKAMESLRLAIDKAKEAGILMFCSACDDIQAGSWEQLPYQRAREHIIRIGAALELGQHDPHTEDVERIDFFFPGHQVREAWNPRMAGDPQYHDGSSVATALAAGLASLILYCALMMHAYCLAQGRAEHERFDQYVTALKQCQGMKRAFNNIQSEAWDRKKYLPVWDVFGRAADGIREVEGSDKWLVLDKMVMHLCSKIV